MLQDLVSTVWQTVTPTQGQELWQSLSFILAAVASFFSVLNSALLLLLRKK